MGSRRCEVKAVMTSSLQEAFLDHRGRTYGHVGAISQSWGRLGDILARCGAILGPLGSLNIAFYQGGMQEIGS